MNFFSQLIEAWKVARTRFPVSEPAAAIDADDLANLALRVAITQLGCGEDGGNNCGDDVARYVAPAKTPANWCAGFVGWCYREAATLSSVPLPFQRSLGAKALGRNVAAVGRRFLDPAEAMPGDLVVWNRGKSGSWMGHVGLVADVVAGKVYTIEGNAGPRVMRRSHEIAAVKDRFSFFATIRPQPLLALRAD